MAVHPTAFLGSMEPASGFDEMLGHILEATGVRLCLVAPDGTILRGDPDWLRTSGCSPERLVDAAVRSLFPDGSGTTELHERARRGEVVAVPAQRIDVGGRSTFWEGRIAPVPMAGGTGLLVVAHDVTERVEAYESLRDSEQRFKAAAITDELTGVSTRRFGLERLGDEIARARRFHRPLSVVMFDLDGFKRINDTYGHDAGDAALRAVGAAARAECRQSDVVVRCGGEEFLLVLPDTTSVAARIAAERLRIRIASVYIEDSGEKIDVTASFGVASIGEAGEEIGETPAVVQWLLVCSDQAMYAAKRRGGDRVAPWEGPPRPA